jgi:adenosylcobinamide amidohydrolase
MWGLMAAFIRDVAWCTEAKASFLKKKKQKTFVSAVAVSTDKSFLVLFFKKELLA